jgi:hypothetical protein
MRKNSLLLRKNVTNLSFILILTLAASAEAAEPVHEHGVGHINITVEKKDVEIELTVPGADAVGFEHAASSDKEKKAVSKADKALRNVTRIIKLSSDAECRVEEVEVSSGLLGDSKETSSSPHKHKAESKNEDKGIEVHAEFTAHYHFHCEYPANLRGAQVGFFSMFPSAHELEAKWITPQGQGAAELTAKSSNLIF